MPGGWGDKLLLEGVQTPGPVVGGGGSTPLSQKGSQTHPSRTSLGGMGESTAAKRLFHCFPSTCFTIFFTHATKTNNQPVFPNFLKYRLPHGGGGGLRRAALSRSSNPRPLPSKARTLEPPPTASPSGPCALRSLPRCVPRYSGGSPSVLRSVQAQARGTV